MGSGVREAFQKIANFEKPDYFPHFEAMGFWEETIRRWYGEGLPLNQTPQQFFQLDLFMDNAPEVIRYHTDTVIQPAYWPPFSVDILEETDEFVIRREGDGIIKKQLKMSTSMPQFLRFPLQDRKGWESLKERLDPESDGRYQGVERIAPELRQRDFILRLGFCGGYGFQRSLFGEEKLAYLYYDEPEFLHDIMEQWAILSAGIADHLCPLIDFDYVFFWEDMAYKTSSLISPQHFQEFILPYYQKLVDHLGETYGLKLFMVDSDGNNFGLLPLFIEGGVNIFLPCEIAAGMEPRLIREKYPDLALLGGIDKRALLKDKSAIQEEIERKVPALLERGGYFPSIDHHIPADISFENFCYYIETLRKVEKEYTNHPSSQEDHRL
ncbi:MAG: hypothetical protein NTX88_03380 [Candidatus Atribacteria bacterium]|nr:hypothetical protein [Candidatus Atribacteria bacterium]